ncbi:MAG: hypothetical protein ACX932_06265 [Gammaproteobacteria bacterium]
MKRNLLNAFNSAQRSQKDKAAEHLTSCPKKRKQDIAGNAENPLKKRKIQHQPDKSESHHPESSLPLPKLDFIDLPKPTYQNAASYSPKSVPSYIKQSPLVKNFKRGDLVYGLKNERRPYTTYLEKKHLHHENTIDNFFNHYYFLEKPDKQYEKNDSLSPNKKNYQNFLFNHPRYNPNRSGGKGYDDAPQMRRSCKAAIEYVLKKGGTIHFILDNIDLTRVIQKQYEKISKKGTKKIVKDLSFTASELRYIYRYQKILDDLPGEVVFYQKGNLCEAPWQIDATQWEERFTINGQSSPRL